MRPTVWPTEARKFIAEKLYTSSHEDVRIWAQLMSDNDDSDLFEMFIARTKQHDVYRGLDFSLVFPELVKFL
jgi:succinate dehydrogenase flavin-adding protein (antitoxin of CptAB toxin-antitoxin module)